jgi:ribosome-associated toxin RatA of RatAB toxin-antitoxin module
MKRQNPSYEPGFSAHSIMTDLSPRKQKRALEERRKTERRSSVLPIYSPERRKCERRTFERRQVKFSVVVKAKRKKVYDIIKHIEEFPKFMSYVKKVKIVERKKDKLVSNWQITVDDISVRWQEEDLFDKQARTVRFRMLKGDFGGYQGEWTLSDTDGGTILSFSCIFNWGIAIAEKHVKAVLERKARRYICGMLLAIKKKAEEKNA